MKTCPVCKARAFSDASTCYGCMHRFTKKDEAVAEPEKQRSDLACLQHGSAYEHVCAAEKSSSYEALEQSRSSHSLPLVSDLVSPPKPKESMPLKGQAAPLTHSAGNAVTSEQNAPGWIVRFEVRDDGTTRYQQVQKAEKNEIMLNAGSPQGGGCALVVSLTPLYKDQNERLASLKSKEAQEVRCS